MAHYNRLQDQHEVIGMCYQCGHMIEYKERYTLSSNRMICTKCKPIKNKITKQILDNVCKRVKEGLHGLDNKQQYDD